MSINQGVEFLFTAFKEFLKAIIRLSLSINQRIELFAQIASFTTAHAQQQFQYPLDTIKMGLRFRLGAEDEFHRFLRLFVGHFRPAFFFAAFFFAAFGLPFTGASVFFADFASTFNGGLPGEGLSFTDSRSATRTA